MRLLYYANKARVKTNSGWDFPEWFPVPQAQLLADMGIKEKHKLYRIRDELLSAGHIEALPAKGREPAQYSLKIPEAVEKVPQNKQGRNQGSFDTDDFFEAALKRSFGEDFDLPILGK